MPLTFRDLSHYCSFRRFYPCNDLVLKWYFKIRIPLSVICQRFIWPGLIDDIHLLSRAGVILANRQQVAALGFMWYGLSVATPFTPAPSTHTHLSLRQPAVLAPSKVLAASFQDQLTPALYGMMPAPSLALIHKYSDAVLCARDSLYSFPLPPDNLFSPSPIILLAYPQEPNTLEISRDQKNFPMSILLSLIIIIRCHL